MAWLNGKAVTSSTIDIKTFYCRDLIFLHYMPEDLTDRQCCHKCQMTVTGKRKLSKCARCHCCKECQVKDWGRHREFCIPVMVSEIPSKGKGLVASKNFKKGELIFQESAIISAKANS